MKYITNIGLTILFVYILSFAFGLKEVFAETYFNDNFDTSLNNWEMSEESGVCDNCWSIENGKLFSVVDGGSSSMLTPKVSLSTNNYKIYYLSKNVSGIDQNVEFRISADGRKYYLVGYRYNDPFWPDKNNIVLYKIVNGDIRLLNKYSPIGFSIEQNTVHKTKIVVERQIIKVYFDDKLVIDTFDYDYPMLQTGSIRLQSWGGSYPGLVKNYIENFNITSVDENENYGEWDSSGKSKNKTIIIPGAGASWNGRGMVYNEGVVDSEWVMTPFANNYDGLIATLEANGKVKGTDFWVWNYDWRRPVAQSVETFNAFVNQKIGSSDKVDIVGHSLGGVIGRIWLQENANDTRIGNVISLGSPQMGAIKAYETWSGGRMMDGAEVTDIAFNLLLKLQSRQGLNAVATARTYAPVLKDLIPTFNYVNKNGVLQAANSLETKNDYLLNKAVIPDIWDKYDSGVGINVSTKSEVLVKERSVFDKVLGQWADGVPTGYSYSFGDGTVLKKSAKFDQDMGGYYEVSSSHGDIVNNSLGMIATKLGLETTLSPTSSMDLRNQLVFYIGSPAYLNVKCGDGAEVKSDELGFVLIKDNSFNTCRIGVVGTNAGEYHLVAGNTSNPNGWNYWQGLITKDEVQNIIIDPRTGKIKTNSDNVAANNQKYGDR